MKRKGSREQFVRGDADRVFREAFEGKTLEQVLFEARRMAKAHAQQHALHMKRHHEAIHQQQQPQHAAADGDPHQRDADPDAAANAAAAGEKTTFSTAFSHAQLLHAKEHQRRHQDNVQKAMHFAAERYAARMQQQYGRGVLSHIRVGRIGKDRFSAFATTTAEATTGMTPVDDFMPFRPFPHMQLPAHVRVPAEPSMGSWERTDAATAAKESLFITTKPAQLQRRKKKEKQPAEEGEEEKTKAGRTTRTTTTTTANNNTTTTNNNEETVSSNSSHRTTEAADQQHISSPSRAIQAEENGEEDLEQEWVAEIVEEDTSTRRRSKRQGALEAFRKTRRYQLTEKDKDIFSIPYNMGQLYSYHRPY